MVRQNYCIKTTKQLLDPIIARHLLPIHAWTGCDTTSAIYNVGKTSILKKVSRSPELQAACSVMTDPRATPEYVHRAGCDMFIILNGSQPGNMTLNKLRYQKYMQLLVNGKSILKPETLRPTEDAAYFHNLRAHLQVINWLALSNSKLNPTDWGWEFDEAMSRFCPIKTTYPAAPDNLLQFIRCKCKSSSKNPCKSNLCSCRKNGLKCVVSCLNCCK